MLRFAPTLALSEIPNLLSFVTYRPMLKDHFKPKDDGTQHSLRGARWSYDLRDDGLHYP